MILRHNKSINIFDTTTKYKSVDFSQTNGYIVSYLWSKKMAYNKSSYGSFYNRSYSFSLNCPVSRWLEGILNFPFLIVMLMFIFIKVFLAIIVLEMKYHNYIIPFHFGRLVGVVINIVKLLGAGINDN